MKRLLIVAAAFLFWASAARGGVDVNSASSSELQMLKGVGPKTAEKILAARDSGGPFTSLDNLAARVKGIGSKTVAKWKSAGNVTCGRPQQAAPPPAAAAAGKITLKKTELIQEIAEIMQKSGYKNYQVNIAAAAQIADYLSEKAGVVFE